MRGRSSMPGRPPSSFGRRRLCGDGHDFAAGSFVCSRQFADTDRHHRVRQYRRNDRRPVGQERTFRYSFSSRHPDELKDMVAKLGSLAQAGTVEQAVAFGDVLFIAVPYGAIPQIGKDYSAAMKGKVDARRLQRSVVARWRRCRRSRAKRDRRDHAEVFPGRAHRARVQHNVVHGLCARGEPTRSETCRYRLPGTTRRPLQIAAALVRDAGFDPVVVGSLPTRGAFSAVNPAMGSKSRPRS